MSGVDFGKKRKAGVGVDGFLWGSFGVLILVSVMCGLVLATGRAQADEMASAAVLVSSSCQLGSNVDQVHQAELTASTYRENIGKTTFTVTCNDANGYSIYAVGYTNMEFGRTDMLGGRTGLTINTGTATSGRTSAWAMKLTPVESDVAPTVATGYNAYHAIPNDYTKVVSFPNSTMRNENGSQFEATYAAFAASTQAPDLYTGKVRYTLVHPVDEENTPCTATYAINYNANGGSGTMDGRTACSGEVVEIPYNRFTEPASVNGMQFAVWNTAADGSGYYYIPGQTIANLADAGGSVTLYAQWAPIYIQELTNSVCSIAAKASPLTVVDRRDENSYTVRYIEGACWMTQNLRIKGMVRSQYSNFSTYNEVNVCEGDLTAGDSYVEARCHDSGNTIYGVWYNYAAASAKTIVSSEDTTTATEDICPSGWHLPSYDSSRPAGSVNSLIRADLVTRKTFTPAGNGSYSYGGHVDGNGGAWWTTLSYNGMYRYDLESGPSANPMVTNWTSGSFGLYVRCVKTSN